MQAGARIQKTGRQSTEAAIAQTRVRLGGGDLLQTEAKVIETLPRRFAKAQVEHGVAEGPAHQKFQGQIMGALAIGLVMGMAGALPALHEAVPHDYR